MVLVGGVVTSCTQQSASISSTACNATTVADKVLPSIVTISAKNGSSTSTGSGEVIRSDGSILTNNHVVSVSANGGSIEVLFSDGTKAPAVITGRDPQTDLAVIKVDLGKSLPVIPLGSSKKVQIGEPVVALGAPLGLSSTITSGIVSALGRTIQVPGDNGQPAVLLSALQTDAAINPGNSGGALTDCAGNLIGVPSATATVTNAAGVSSAGSVGLGFAIPVDVATKVSDELISTGTVTHSYLGLEVIEIPPAAAKQAGQPEGLFVSTVAPNGPSANAGLLPEDVITGVDGKPVTDADQLAALTLAKKPGESVTITFIREGKSMDVTVTLGSPP
jgi:putative serine protease PepD